MIRVGFFPGFLDDGWLGGVNYFRNLLNAIATLPDRRIEPVFFAAGSSGRKALEGLPEIELIESEILRGRGRLWTPLRTAGYALLRRDVVVAGFWRWHRISVMSHSGPRERDRPMPAICWIPDFQHVHLPEFFSAGEIAARNKANAATAAKADIVILSSEDARRDYCRLYPQSAAKARVLRFVAEVADDADVPSRDDLARLYGATSPYFIVANQFWAHKNHRLIIDALSVLKGRGLAPPVLATGNAVDHRAPGFYGELQRHAEARNVLDCFRPLGVVPRAHLTGLMRHSVAVLNPSKFEGWNTSIEEAKTLGARVVASDIPVHREQDAPGALYVHPDRPEEMADAMARQWAMREQVTPGCDRAAFLRRREAFARAYQAIVLELDPLRSHSPTPLHTQDSLRVMNAPRE